MMIDNCSAHSLDCCKWLSGIKRGSGPYCVSVQPGHLERLLVAYTVAANEFRASEWNPAVYQPDDTGAALFDLRA